MSKPFDFSQEIASQIITRIMDGEMLTAICKEQDMPSRLTFYRWMKGREELKNDYTRARLAWADWWAERVLAISLDSSGDIFIDGSGKAVIDHANVQRARLQTDNIKWLVGKYAPRTYGDKPVEEQPRHIAFSWKQTERTVVAQPPPRQITYDPGPLPSRLAPEVMRRFWQAVKDIVPHADQRDPNEVMTRVIDVCVNALKAEFAPEVA